jgi:diguanylate cyclase
VSMAQGLDLEVIAEGVSTPKQIDFLKGLQCGQGQGFYFSKAVSSNELEKLLKNPSVVADYLPKGLDLPEK